MKTSDTTALVSDNTTPLGQGGDLSRPPASATARETLQPSGESKPRRKSGSTKGHTPHRKSTWKPLPEGRYRVVIKSIKQKPGRAVSDDQESNGNQNGEAIDGAVSDDQESNGKQKGEALQFVFLVLEGDQKGRVIAERLLLVQTFRLAIFAHRLELTPYPLPVGSIPVTWRDAIGKQVVVDYGPCRPYKRRDGTEAMWWGIPFAGIFNLDDPEALLMRHVPIGSTRHQPKEKDGQEPRAKKRENDHD